MIKQVIASFLFITLFIGCSSQKKINAVSLQITQGISGQVFEISGDMMPSPNNPKAKFVGRPMKTSIAVFQVLNNASMQKKNGLFINMESTPVSVVKTNEKGEFYIALDEGVYSVLIKMDNGYFANRFDEKMSINTVTVKKDSLTNIKMEFDLHTVN